MRLVNREWTRMTFIAAALVWSLGVPALAGSPEMIRYQARLTDAAGVPLFGSHTLVFTIHDDPTLDTPLWSETRPSVDVGNGTLDILLGQVNPLTSNILAVPGAPTARWLEITVDGKVLVPRQQLASTPFALVSDRLGTMTLQDVQADVDTRIATHAANPSAHHPPVGLDEAYDRGGMGLGRTLTAEESLELGLVNHVPSRDRTGLRSPGHSALATPIPMRPTSSWSVVVNPSSKNWSCLRRRTGRTPTPSWLSGTSITSIATKWAGEAITRGCG